MTFFLINQFLYTLELLVWQIMFLLFLLLLFFKLQLWKILQILMRLAEFWKLMFQKNPVFLKTPKPFLIIVIAATNRCPSQRLWILSGFKDAVHLHLAPKHLVICPPGNKVDVVPVSASSYHVYAVPEKTDKN